MDQKTVFALSASLAGLALTGAAQASIVSLNFEGISPYPSADGVQIGNLGGVCQVRNFRRPRCGIAAHKGWPTTRHHGRSVLSESVDR